MEKEAQLYSGKNKNFYDNCANNNVERREWDRFCNWSHLLRCYAAEDGELSFQQRYEDREPRKILTVFIRDVKASLSFSSRATEITTLGASPATPLPPEMFFHPAIEKHFL
ncbi:hypothetical protein CDAR_497341 [Caerostris darwini]|uniref:Uncharacterized protein n=1 Tax=Caerostris darwini TaxID=1538125 RepID=A0AAV4S0S8_9ARAC|nr:hypothetical protein CDAR_497341 [Caerostris darwini]